MISHRLSYTRAYRAWGHMMSRCYNPLDLRYPRYGGRGITVCKRWHRVENFFADMGEIPLGLTLERKNTNLGYSRANCCWATNQEQSNNRSTNIWVTWRGERRTIAQWARLRGLKIATLWHRIRAAKWPLDRAMAYA